jgi:hypothetical protein
MLILKRREISIDELSELTGLSRKILLEKLSSLNKYVSMAGERVVLEKPLILAIDLLRRGYSFKDVSKYLDWRDFEKFSAEILSGHRYVVKTNFRLTRPVMLEIDVIGIDIGSGRGIFIDCKHWTHGISKSMLINIADKHFNRIEKFTKYFSWARNKWYYFKYLRRIIPLIVTLTRPSVRVHNNVLIVSIEELNSVLLNIDEILDVFGVTPIRIK